MIIKLACHLCAVWGVQLLTQMGVASAAHRARLLIYRDGARDKCAGPQPPQAKAPLTQSERSAEAAVQGVPVQSSSRVTGSASMTVQVARREVSPHWQASTASSGGSSSSRHVVVGVGVYAHREENAMHEQSACARACGAAALVVCA